MKYEDPIIKENVNISKEPILKTFLKLFSSLLIIITIAYLLIIISINHLVQFIPYSYERSLSGKYLNTGIIKETKSKKYKKENQKLQNIADRLIAAVYKANKTKLPKDFKVSVYYIDDKDVNAFASFGGNIFINKGLISVMENENTLAMVIAHEMAHVLHRDSVKALGRITASSLLIGSFLGVDIASVNTTTIALELKYSRKTEQKADDFAISAINDLYANAYGADRLFELFEVIQPSENKLLEISQSHYFPKNRRKYINKIIKKRNYKVDKNNLKPLDAQLHGLN